MMIDFKKIKAFYNLGKELDLKDIAALLKAAKLKTYKKGEILIELGSEQNNVFFIRKGLVRSYCINDKGDEVCFQFFHEQQFVASTDKILFHQASKYFYQALEDLQVLVIDYNVLQSIIEEHPNLEKNRKFFFQKIMRQMLLRLESFVLLSPEDRYLKYIALYPDITNRVPNKYLANILGITPVSLSRIRKRLASKNK